MKNAKRDWTDELPGLLEGYTEQEPDGLWEAVRDAAVPRRRKAAAWWYAGGGLAAAAAIAALILLVRPAAPVPPAISGTGERLAEQTRPATEAVGPEETELTAEAMLPVPGPQTANPSAPAAGRQSQTASPRQQMSQGSPHQQTLQAPSHQQTPQASPSQDETASSEPPAPETPAAEIPGAEEIPGTEEAGSTSSQAPGPEPRQSAPSTSVPLHQTRPRRTVPERTQVRVQLGVTANLLAQASTQSLSGSPALLAQASSPALPGIADAPATRSMYSGGNVWDVMMAGRNKPVTTEASHRQSARFGIGIKLGLLPRWGLETGLVGTQLQSTFRSPAGNAMVTTEHAYTYWGVPLYLHFDAFQWRSLDLYLAGGPMLEWTRSRKENQYLELNGRRMASRSAATPLRDTRVSFDLGAGLQWTFFEHNALFVQPGFSWHLPSEGAPSHFYSAHPAAFQLTLGYRLLLF